MIEFFIKTLFVYFVSQLAAETKLTSARFAEQTEFNVFLKPAKIFFTKA